jgi:5-formyltetrahydrofolate cyclo-ligase
MRVAPSPLQSDSHSMKGKLRKELRAKRRSIGAADHALRSDLAASFLTRMPAFKSGARIAAYLPFDGEADTAALLLAARRRGVRIFVPVVSDRRHRRLRFYPLSGKTRRGVFGISIPHRNGTAIEPRWFDLIVVPLVGVDHQGRRLGLGGGFYDRALAFRRQRRHWRGPRLVGLGFECQRAESVFAEAWDVRLDDLATESTLRHFFRGMQ